MNLANPGFSWLFHSFSFPPYLWSNSQLSSSGLSVGQILGKQFQYRSQCWPLGFGLPGTCPDISIWSVVNGLYCSLCYILLYLNSAYSSSAIVLLDSLVLTENWAYHEGTQRHFQGSPLSPSAGIVSTLTSYFYSTLLTSLRKAWGGSLL
jgi:hypothetical protein